MTQSEDECFQLKSRSVRLAAVCACSVKVSRGLNFHTVSVCVHDRDEGTKRTTYRETKSGGQLDRQCRVHGKEAGFGGKGRGWGMTCNLRPLTPDLYRKIRGVCLCKQLEWRRRWKSLDGQIGGVVSELMWEGWKMDSIQQRGVGANRVSPRRDETQRIASHWRKERYIHPSTSFLLIVVNMLSKRDVDLLSCKSRWGLQFTSHILYELEEMKLHNFFPKSVDKNVNNMNIRHIQATYYFIYWSVSL